ncbi:MAG: GWxTD domain-containing protein [Deferribacteres bacterium]|nr:GWxTD domain-containing protein [candidate division KSB1 bacterium]MCB9511118.1 GWxTD domain-containing protein [Deferribacteres bacterium]
MKISKVLLSQIVLALAFGISVFFLTTFPTKLNATIPEKSHKDFQRALQLLDKNKYEQAEIMLREILAGDSLFRAPSGKSAWGPLAQALLGQNLIGESIAMLETGYRLFFAAGIAEPYLAYDLSHLLAQYHYEDRKLEMTSLYYDALENVQPQQHSDLWETIYSQSEFLLSKAEMSAVTQSVEKGAAAGAILANFFQTNDFEPFTAENEFLIAYLRRVVKAREQFFNGQTPAQFDERGKIYVRFGKPDRVVTDRSGELGEVGWKMHPYEVWFYKRIGADMYFTFVGKSDNRDYRWVDGPESIFGRFYSGRKTMFGQKVARTGETAMALRDELYTSLAPWHKTFRERLFRLSTMQSLREAADYASLYFQQEDREYTERIVKMAPTIVFDEGGDMNALPLSISHAAFRENDHFDRLELYYSVPYNALFFERTIGKFKAQIRCRIAVFDENFQSILADTVEQILYEKKQNETTRGHFLSQFNAKLPAGTYHAVVQIEDVYSKKRGFARFPFTLRTFSESRLAVSDIQLSPHIQETQEQFEFAKNGVLVTPLPSSRLGKNKPLYLYYEIYHLTQKQNGETRYKVEYKLRTADLQKSNQPGHSIALSEQRATTSAHQSEYLAMDASRFKAGDAVLEIFVTDLLNNAIAFSEVRLTLEE